VAAKSCVIAPCWGVRMKGRTRANRKGERNLLAPSTRGRCARQRLHLKLGESREQGEHTYQSQFLRGEGRW
jgi:hypothetical protein